MALTIPCVNKVGLVGGVECSIQCMNSFYFENTYIKTSVTILIEYLIWLTLH